MRKLSLPDDPETHTKGFSTALIHGDLKMEWATLIPSNRCESKARFRNLLPGPMVRWTRLKDTLVEISENSESTLVTSRRPTAPLARHLVPPLRGTNHTILRIGQIAFNLKVEEIGVVPMKRVGLKCRSLLVTSLGSVLLGAVRLVSQGFMSENSIQVILQ